MNTKRGIALLAIGGTLLVAGLAAMSLFAGEHHDGLARDRVAARYALGLIVFTLSWTISAGREGAPWRRIGFLALLWAAGATVVWLPFVLRHVLEAQLCIIVVLLPLWWYAYRQKREERYVYMRMLMVGYAIMFGVSCFDLSVTELSSGPFWYGVCRPLMPTAVAWLACLLGGIVTGLGSRSLAQARAELAQAGAEC